MNPTNRSQRPTPRPIRKKRSYAAALTQPAMQHRPRVHLHKVIGVILIVLAAVLVVTHQAEHAGAISVMPRRYEDLLIGFPVAAVLFLGGFFAFIWR